VADSIISIRRVSKSFGSTHAVRNLDLDVPRGSLCGFLGPNGAGKSTTIRMIMSIIYPDSGTIEVLGGNALASKDRIGYLPEERGVYRKMRVGEFLEYLARLKGVHGPEVARRVHAWLERIELPGVDRKRCQELSKGMQQKVQFISTMLHDPDLVILDEPFSGLDPVNSQVLRDTVVDYRRRGKTVLFSTHIMEHAEKLCDRLCIIARGKKLIDGTLTEVKRTHGGKHVIVAFDGTQGGAQQVFGDRRLVAKIQDFGQQAELELAPGADAQEILRALVNSGARLSHFELASPSLHKIFVDLVGPEAATAAAVPAASAGGARA
jgi:ABC-2 type transport system ATP-binding protein